MMVAATRFCPDSLVWLYDGTNQAWPAVIVRSVPSAFLGQDCQWVVREFGSGREPERPVPPDHLHEYTAHLYLGLLGMQPGGEHVRTALAEACIEAHEFGRANGPESQRNELKQAAFDVLISTLRGNDPNAATLAPAEKRLKLASSLRSFNIADPGDILKINMGSCSVNGTSITTEHARAQAHGDADDLDSQDAIKLNAARKHRDKCKVSVDEQVDVVRNYEQELREAKYHALHTKKEGDRRREEEKNLRDKDVELRRALHENHQLLAEAITKVHQWSSTEVKHLKIVEQKQMLHDLQKTELNDRKHYHKCAQALVEKLQAKRENTLTLHMSPDKPGTDVLVSNACTAIVPATTVNGNVKCNTNSNMGIAANRSVRANAIADADQEASGGTGARVSSSNSSGTGVGEFASADTDRVASAATNSGAGAGIGAGAGAEVGTDVEMGAGVNASVGFGFGVRSTAVHNGSGVIPWLASSNLNTAHPEAANGSGVSVSVSKKRGEMENEIVSHRSRRAKANQGSEGVEDVVVPHRRYIEASKMLGCRFVVKSSEGGEQANKSEEIKAEHTKSDLLAFLATLGIHDYLPPISQGKEIDAYLALKSALEWGGWDAIRKDAKLGQLCDKVQVPRGSVGTLKRFYITYLYQYECALVAAKIPSSDEIDAMLAPTPKRKRSLSSG